MGRKRVIYSGTELEIQKKIQNNTIIGYSTCYRGDIVIHSVIVVEDTK